MKTSHISAVTLTRVWLATSTNVTAVTAVNARNIAPTSLAKCSLYGPSCGSQLMPMPMPMPGKVSYQWRGAA
ncbi:hypothetical protein AWC11_05465 [Mycobacterium interjectum]|nr:hypothetical protein AWC11_05465 [Mycobacterium interjectum]